MSAGLGSIEHLFDSTIHEISEQLDERHTVTAATTMNEDGGSISAIRSCNGQSSSSSPRCSVTGKIAETDRKHVVAFSAGRESEKLSEKERSFEDGSEAAGRGLMTNGKLHLTDRGDKKEEVSVGVNRAGTGTNSSYATYDELPYPVPVSMKQESHRRFTPASARAGTKHVRIDDGVATVGRKAAIGGPSDTAKCGVSHLPFAGCLNKDRVGNERGRLVISWNDTRTASATNNTVDASVCIGAGTVASRVSIFDVKPQAGGQDSSRPSVVKRVHTNIGIAKRKPPPTPSRVRVVSSVEQRTTTETTDRSPTSQPLKSQKVPPQKPTYENDLQMSDVPPSPSVSFLPPPPPSWLFGNETVQCDELREDSFTTVVEVKDDRSQPAVDMLKFRVDTKNRHHVPTQQQQQRETTGDDNSGGGFETAVPPPVSRPDQYADFNAIGLQLEKLIASIDLQSKNIDTINHMLSSSREIDVRRTSVYYPTSRNSVYYPTTKREREICYKTKDDASSSKDREESTKKSSSGKDGAKGNLLSCIR